MVLVIYGLERCLIKMKYQEMKTQTIVKIALYAAVVATVTMFTSVQFAAGGYFNLGDVVVMLLAALIPFRHAAMAVAVGSVTADLLLGAVLYSPFTGLIKVLMALVVYLMRATLNKKYYFVPFLLASLLMVGLYGLVDAFILGGYTFFASVAANAIQGLLGFVITAFVYPFSMKLRDFLEE